MPRRSRAPWAGLRASSGPLKGWSVPWGCIGSGRAALAFGPRLAARGGGPRARRTGQPHLDAGARFTSPSRRARASGRDARARHWRAHHASRAVSFHRCAQPAPVSRASTRAHRASRAVNGRCCARNPYAGHTGTNAQTRAPGRANHAGRVADSLKCSPRPVPISGERCCPPGRARQMCTPITHGGQRTRTGRLTVGSPRDHCRAAWPSRCEV
jgi:hypothetical protein